jgi:hypothetical protein
MATKSQDSSIILHRNELTPREQFICNHLNVYDWNGRKVVIGIHNKRIEWTDGCTFIALDRAYLSGLNLSSTGGASSLVATLFHALAHDSSDIKTHKHGLSFYKKYHDLTQDNNGDGNGPFAVMQAVLESMRTYDRSPISRRKRV